MFVCMYVYMYVYVLRYMYFSVFFQILWIRNDIKMCRVGTFLTPSVRKRKEKWIKRR